MVSTFSTLERFTHRPRILDVDDAVWLNRNEKSNFADLVRSCDAVICGNSFLQETIRHWKSETTVLPTAVDTTRFCVAPACIGTRATQIVGWSGTSSSLKYLYGIESALVSVLEKCKRAIVRVVCDSRPHFTELDPSRVEYVKWSIQNEVEAIRGMSIGLMPMDDSIWARGKCSYKMLLYMSCGVPPVVSPVGMNKEVLLHGSFGLGPLNNSEWVDAICMLLQRPAEANMRGTEARKVVESHYSLDVLAPRLAEYLRKIALANT